eukprot:scaffold12214_cov159-Amphora_coffeaeformis.AAC.2
MTAGNTTDLFALIREGTVHSLMKGSEEWVTYKGASKVSRIVASGACCAGSNGTETDVNVFGDVPSCA